MLLTVSFLSGPIYDRGHLRTLVQVGSFSLVFGLMMLSICKTYWQVLLAQGFCIGIGAGCLWVPCVAILPTYFNTKLGLVVGLAFSGSSVGGVVYPIVFYQLINRIGFGWSVRVLGFIALGTLLFPLAVMKMRVKPPKPRSLIDWTAFLDFPYMMFTIAGLIGYIGLFSLFFYISFYPYARHITDRKLAFYIVPIFNAASVLGRIVPNAISDKTGPFNLIAPGVLIFGVLNFCMMAVTTVAADVVMAILTGFFSGLFICLPPVCFVALTNDKSKIGTRMGMGYSIIALGVLAGGPGGGNILGTVDPLNWNGLWAYSGATTCAAGLLFAAVRVVRSGWKLNIKA